MSLAATISWALLQWRLLLSRRTTVLLLLGWFLLLLAGLGWDRGLLGLATALPFAGVVLSCGGAWGGRDERALRDWAAPLQFSPAILLLVTLLSRTLPWYGLVIAAQLGSGGTRSLVAGWHTPPALVTALALVLGFGVLGLLLSVLVPGDQNAFLLVVVAAGSLIALPVFGPGMDTVTRSLLALVNPVFWITPAPSWQGLAGAGGAAVGMFIVAMIVARTPARPSAEGGSCALLRVAGLHKVFRTPWRRSSVLRGVSFSVPAGRVVGLLGRNGAGKTTTLRIIVGTLAPTHGEVHWTDEAPWQVRWLPEEDPFSPGLSPGRYLAVMGARRGDERTSRLATVLGVGQLLDRPAGELSVGQRRRCALLVTLAAQARLYVLDEVGAGIDPVEMASIKKVLKELATQGAAVLLSTHLLRDFESCLDETVMIHSGAVVVSGNVKTLRDSLAVCRAGGLARGSGVSDPPIVVVDERLIMAADDRDCALEQQGSETDLVTTGSVTLEDVFHWYLQDVEGA